MTDDIMVVFDRKSSLTWESTVAPDVAAACSSGEIQRQNAIMELIETEVQYRDKLQMVMDVYLKPLKVKKILQTNEIGVVFANWLNLLKRSKDLCKSFKQRQEEQNGLISTLADILNTHAPKIQVLYSKYVEGQSEAMKLLVDIEKSNATFAAFQRDAMPQSGNLPLVGHLLEPLQRLLRYKLLVTNILHNTPTSHDHFEVDRKIVEVIGAIAHEVNESKRLMEATERMKYLEEKIHFQYEEAIDLCAATKEIGERVLVKEVDVWDKRDKRRSKWLTLFLFNDFLLVAKQGQRGSSVRQKHPEKGSGDVYNQEFLIPVRYIAAKIEDNCIIELNNESTKVKKYVRMASSGSAKALVDIINDCRVAYQNQTGGNTALPTPTRSSTDIGTLKLTIHGGFKLRAMDNNGLSDPYCKVTLGNQEERTSTVMNNLNPVWDHDAIMLVNDRNDVLHFSVFDEDAFSEDDLIGECTYPLSNVEENDMQWVTLTLESPGSASKKTMTIKVLIVLHLF